MGSGLGRRHSPSPERNTYCNLQFVRGTV